MSNVNEANIPSWVKRGAKAGAVGAAWMVPIAGWPLSYYMYRKLYGDKKAPDETEDEDEDE